MYKAVISDLDGTLLNHEHEITKETIDTIRSLKEKGYNFYIATGRLHKRVKPIIDKIGLKTDVVCLNGARVVDKDGNEIFSKKMDKKDNDILLSIDYKSFGNEIFINGYIGDSWYVVNNEGDKYYKERKLKEDEMPTIIPIEEFQKIHFNKVYYIGKHENLLKLEKYIQSLNLNVNLSFVSEVCLEIYHKDCNKYNASKILLDRDNIKLNEVIAFGDGINDIEMLEQIPTSYMMENSIYLLDQRLKKDSNVEKIGHHKDSAVAKKIREIFKLEI